MARVAQGSGSAERVVLGVLVAVQCFSLLASSATLTVGDTQGWTIGPDYAAWAASQTFSVGDVLLFAYLKGSHNVVEVNKTGYDACSGVSGIATFTDGNTSVSLTSAGSRYFLCSFPSHCTSGMHLAVTVGAGATPAPAPSTSVGTPPQTPATSPPPAPPPTSATTPPTSPPTPTPTASVPSPVSVGSTPVPSASAPVPTPAASTPSPTPAPTPLSPSPASAPTPASPPTPTSAASPPSPGTPTSTTGTPPPSSAPHRPSSASLAAVILGLGGAILAL